MKLLHAHRIETYHSNFLRVYGENLERHISKHFPKFHDKGDVYENHCFKIYVRKVFENWDRRSALEQKARYHTHFKC